MVNRVSIGGTIDYEHENAQCTVYYLGYARTKVLGCIWVFSTLNPCRYPRMVDDKGELVNRPLAVKTRSVAASILGHFTLTYDDFAT